MFPSAVSTDVPRLLDTENETESKASIASDRTSAFMLTAHETASSTAIMSPSSRSLLPPATGFTMKTGLANDHAAPNQGQTDDAMQTRMSAAEFKRTIEVTDLMNTEANHPSGESNATFINVVKESNSDKTIPSLLARDSTVTNGPVLRGQDFTNVSSNNVASQTSNSSESFESVPITSSEPYKPLFGLTSEPVAPKSSFGGFSFQVASVTEKAKSQVPVAPVVPSSISSPTPAQSEQKKEIVGFTFSASQPQSSSTSSFTFGGGGSVASDISKPFSFGSSPASLLGRPVTPPKAQDQEVQMDESPTRDVQPSNVKPTVIGFSFGQTPTSSSLFGTRGNGNAPGSTPFAFGAPQPLATNVFATSAKEAKPVQNKPTSFAQTSSYSFGQNKAPDVAGSVQSPTSGPFSFGPNANTFAFGPPSNASTNPFGQPQTSSAPSSPATFGASPFSFSASTSNTAFAFGSSQPASPVGGSNLSLPQSGTSGFGNSGFGQSAPSSPFSTTSPLAPSAPAAPLFTIGSAPAVTPGAPRQIKKLPTRRTGPKR